MPLSTPEGRTLLTTRVIECAGYECADGLLDIEGRLQDVNNHPVENPWRALPAGQPVHVMQVRLRVDDTLTIHAVEVSMDSAPYPFCQGAKPNVQRLVGLKITGGFKQQVRKLIGHTEGCTHVLTLIDVLSAVAVRSLAGKGRRRGSTSLEVFGARDPGRTPLLDTCYSYAATSPVVEKLYPEHYRPPQAQQKGVEEGGDSSTS